MKILFSLLFLFIFMKADENIPLHLLPNSYFTKNKNLKNQHNHTHHRKSKDIYRLVGYEDTMKGNVTYHFSNLEKTNLNLSGNKIIIPKNKYGNYHTLVAQTQTKNKKFTSIYYMYKFGKPSKTSPSKLTSKQKSYFEIHPNPLPSEHDRYFGSKEYDFILKLDNKPLANQTITLKTFNGTLKTVSTNEKGEFNIKLPDDFKNVKTGRRANKPSYFILYSSFLMDNKKHYTSFTSEYHVNPNDYWRNTPTGIVIAFVGFIIGLFILWRRKNG